MTVEERLEAHDRQIEANSLQIKANSLQLAELFRLQQKNEILQQNNEVLMAQVGEDIRTLAVISQRQQEEILQLRREFQAYLNRLPPQ